MQWIALYYLGNREEISQRDLATDMKIKESTVVRLIDRMEREELVQRRKNDNDKRVMNLVLTEKGKRYREELLPEGYKFNDIVSEGITEEEMKVFRIVLDKMVNNIRKHMDK